VVHASDIIVKFGMEMTSDSFIKYNGVAALSQESIDSEITAIACVVCSHGGLNFVGVQTRQYRVR
jgi:hypothetical protein